LLVDDEPNILSALRHLLRKDGYRILHCFRRAGRAGNSQQRKSGCDYV
jgi:response regulator RpfG family c-di-GMP phosphodiesterase